MSLELKPDPIYVKIILELAEKGSLTRMEIARIVDSNFPYVPRPEKYRLVLKDADNYARLLEKRGLARKAYFKGREYSLQITDPGKEEALKLSRVVK